MYTQCPDCRVSFRVTAAVLQQAAGRVRCGGCGHAFNALERLSETAPPEGGDRPGGNARSLLDDFGELSSADNVRIEDTGVEWQVVEDEQEKEGEGAAASHPQESLDLAEEREPAEERYDDNTPLPGVLDDDEDARAPEPPRRRAEDFLEPRSPEFDERQVDLALSEPEDWTDLLAEVGDEGGPEPADRAALESNAWQPDEDTHSDLRTLAEDLEPTGEHPALVADDEPMEESRDEAGGAEAAASAPEDGGHYVPPPTEEEITINRLIDQDLLRLSQEQREQTETSPGSEALAETPSHVETIIMEGAFVRSSLEADDPAALEEPVPAGEAETEEIIDLRDTYVRSRDGARRGLGAGGATRYAAMAGIAALALLLGAQVVHAYRATLATYGGLGQTLSSLYELAGTPITPEWNVNGWQFEATRGSTDAMDRALTISSRIANASEQALPYPLLHVALTDRYEEIIASQLLEAGQYLEIRAANGRVAPGGKLQASITIAPLSPQAAGFKVNVCYPLSGEQVRCATGAFKDR